MRRLAALALSAAAVLAAPPASAQQDFSRVEIRTERLAPGVAVLLGAGGNIGLSYGEDGNVLIDDQYAPLAPRIAAAVRAIDPDPIKFLVNTHWHGDHTGGNEAFGKGGAVIVAHENVRRRLSAESLAGLNRTTPPSPKAALPVVTFAQEVSFHLNGDRLQVVHAPNGHTDGDSMVYWTNANIIHMGDLFFHQASFPFIDRDSGGSIDGVIQGVTRGLALVKPGGKVIPGHGPIGTREDLAAYLAMLTDIRAKVAVAIAAGRTRAQVIADDPTARYTQVARNGFIKPADFIGGLYDELSAAARR